MLFAWQFPNAIPLSAVGRGGVSRTFHDDGQLEIGVAFAASPSVPFAGTTRRHGWLALKFPAAGFDAAAATGDRTVSFKSESGEGQPFFGRSNSALPVEGVLRMARCSP